MPSGGGIDKGKLLKRILLAALGIIILILIFLLLEDCDGISNSLGIGGDTKKVKVEAVSRPEPKPVDVFEPNPVNISSVLAGGTCACCDPEEFKRLIKEAMCELEEEGCPKPEPPPPPPKPVATVPAGPKKNCQKDLGDDWQCLEYAKYTYKDLKHGYCPGKPNTVKCILKAELKPPEEVVPDEPDPPQCEVRLFTSERRVNTMHSDIWEMEGVSLLEPQAVIEVEWMRRTFSPTKTVRVCVPPGTKIEYANLGANVGTAKESWSVSTKGAFINQEEGKEYSNPNFKMWVDGRELKFQDSIKLGPFWNYRID